MQERRTLSKTQ